MLTIDDLVDLGVHHGSYFAVNPTAQIFYAWRKRNPGVVGRCAVCGMPPGGEGPFKIEGHHFVYQSPLMVIWLCAMHHREVHRGLNRLKKRKRRRLDKSAV